MIDLQLSVSSSTGTRHGDGESSPRATVRLFRKRRKNKVRDEWGNCIGECADNCCAKPLLFEKKNNVFLSVSFPSSLFGNFKELEIIYVPHASLKVACSSLSCSFEMRKV
tara:strand:+ start:235 stop:564 length:330 start_codon:yes stop_codon:yes gene_type:complete